MDKIKYVDHRIVTNGKCFRVDYKFNTSDEWYIGISDYKTFKDAEASWKCLIEREKAEEESVWVEAKEECIQKPSVTSWWMMPFLVIPWLIVALSRCAFLMLDLITNSPEYLRSKVPTFKEFCDDIEKIEKERNKDDATGM